MKHCVEYVSLSVRSSSVCLSARISQKPHGVTSPFLCVLSVTVARSSSDGVAISNIIPVL